MGEEKIAMVVSRARKFWLIVMAAFALLIGLNFSPFYLVFLIPIGVVLYFTTLLFTVKYLQMTLTVADFPEDHMAKVAHIQDQIEKGEIKPGPELMQQLAKAGGNIQVTTILATSPAFGKIGDCDMHEWIDIQDLATNEVARYEYHSIAVATPDGRYGVPNVVGKHFAIYDGCVYVRDLTST